MKIIKTVGAVALVTMLVSGAFAQQHPAAQGNGGDAHPGPVPVLTMESFTHDFGEVKPGEPLRYAFKVKNEGKADLLINSVSPG